MNEYSPSLFTHLQDTHNIYKISLQVSVRNCYSLVSFSSPFPLRADSVFYGISWEMDTKVRVSVTTAQSVVINKTVLFFFPTYCLCCNLHSLAFTPPSATIISDNVLEIIAGFSAGVHTFVIICQHGLGILLLHLAKSNSVCQTAALSWKLTHACNERTLLSKDLMMLLACILGCRVVQQIPPMNMSHLTGCRRCCL